MKGHSYATPSLIHSIEKEHFSQLMAHSTTTLFSSLLNRINHIYRPVTLFYSPILTQGVQPSVIPLTHCIYPPTLTFAIYHMTVTTSHLQATIRALGSLEHSPCFSPCFLEAIFHPVVRAILLEHRSDYITLLQIAF